MQESVLFPCTAPAKDRHPKPKNESGEKKFPDSLLKYLAEANIGNFPEISDYPFIIFSIFGINVTSAGSQSTEPNCVDVNHLAASCSSKCGLPPANVQA